MVCDWPTRGLDKDVMKNVMDYVPMHLKIVNMLLTIWQVLYAASIKEATSTSTSTLLMPLPSKDICLKVTKSKMQLITLICMCLQEWCEQLHKMEESL